MNCIVTLEMQLNQGDFSVKISRDMVISQYDLCTRVTLYISAYHIFVPRLST